MKTDNTQGQTQRPLDVAMHRGASLSETLRAAQLMFGATIRSPMSTEQRLELLERVVLLQSEVILATLGVLTEHDGKSEQLADDVDELQAFLVIDPTPPPAPAPVEDTEIA